MWFIWHFSDLYTAEIATFSRLQERVINVRWCCFCARLFWLGHCRTPRGADGRCASSCSDGPVALFFLLLFCCWSSFLVFAIHPDSLCWKKILLSRFWRYCCHGGCYHSCCTVKFEPIASCHKFIDISFQWQLQSTCMSWRPRAKNPNFPPHFCISKNGAFPDLNWRYLPIFTFFARSCSPIFTIGLKWFSFLDLQDATICRSIVCKLCVTNWKGMKSSIKRWLSCWIRMR